MALDGAYQQGLRFLNQNRPQGALRASLRYLDDALRDALEVAEIRKRCFGDNEFTLQVLSLDVMFPG